MIVVAMVNGEMCVRQIKSLLSPSLKLLEDGPNNYLNKLVRIVSTKITARFVG
jgi:hypothetical protein